MDAVVAPIVYPGKFSSKLMLSASAAAGEGWKPRFIRSGCEKLCPPFPYRCAKPIGKWLRLATIARTLPAPRSYSDDIDYNVDLDPPSTRPTPLGPTNCCGQRAEGRPSRREIAFQLNSIHKSKIPNPKSQIQNPMTTIPRRDFLAPRRAATVAPGLLAGRVSAAPPDASQTTEVCSGNVCVSQRGDAGGAGKGGVRAGDLRRHENRQARLPGDGRCRSGVENLWQGNPPCRNAQRGRRAAHFGWNACSSCHGDPDKMRRYLVLPGLRSSRIHISIRPIPRAEIAQGDRTEGNRRQDEPLRPHRSLPAGRPDSCSRCSATAKGTVPAFLAARLQSRSPPLERRPRECGFTTTSGISAA